MLSPAWALPRAVGLSGFQVSTATTQHWTPVADEERFFFRTTSETGGAAALFTADFFFDLESGGKNCRLGPPAFKTGRLGTEWNPYDGCIDLHDDDG